MSELVSGTLINDNVLQLKYDNGRFLYVPFWVFRQFPYLVFENYETVKNTYAKAD